MTPEDFLRSITPGQKQPEKFGLDKFKVNQKIEPQIKVLKLYSLFLKFLKNTIS